MLVVIVFAIGVTLISLNSGNNNVSKIGKYIPLNVKTNSMEPTIMKGDFIVAEEVDTKDLKVGDVISFLATEQDTVIVKTHRIISIDDSTNDNELDERIKVLTRGGKVICSPILQVRTKNVIANHGNSISNIDKSALFYLESKGISEENAIRLIEDSYLYGPFKDNEEFKNMIK